MDEASDIGGDSNPKDKQFWDNIGDDNYNDMSFMPTYTVVVGKSNNESSESESTSFDAGNKSSNSSNNPSVTLSGNKPYEFGSKVTNGSYKSNTAVGQAGGSDFSLAGMYLHFQFGGGSMTINMASIDFSGTSQRVLGLAGMKPNDIRGVSLFKAGAFFPAALAFGNVRMKYYGNDRFSIIGDDNARFDFSPLVGGSSSERDAGNLFGVYINYNLWAIPISPLFILPPLINGPYDVKFIDTTKIPK